MKMACAIMVERADPMLRMLELSRYFFVAGALPFLAMGVAHAVLTPLAVGDRKGLSPSDTALSSAMAKTPLSITKRTDMWRCWVGFNLSHSLGLLLFAAFVLVIGRSGVSFAQQARVLVPLTVIVSASYLCLAMTYWFRTPIIGCVLSVGCFVASWILLLRT
jgi:hypothetical protein